MPVETAIIPAAGMGTRFLPASKAVPKELVTVVDRPVIQYAVEELVRAGIRNICIVTSEGKEALTHHFTSNAKLETVLRDKGKTDLLEEMLELNKLADIYSVTQNEPLGLGHAVWVARDHVDDDPFVVLLPDEILDPADDFLSEMIGTHERTGSSVIAVDEVPHESIGSYGCIDPEPADGDAMRVRAIIEKPDPAEAPSDLALIGRYVLSPDVMEILETVEPGAGGEIQLTDALAVLAAKGKLVAQRYRGRRWDAGTKLGYLQATAALAFDHPELGPEFRAYLEKIQGGVPANV
ncbi:MAG TPA: UTP--glucose-1-phosphate uridylyltransferase [Actinomycetota bacterium]|nr:UTP--glucose-1-phosphate uridylyltransferase [Actinomycetota bacterium]